MGGQEISVYKRGDALLVHNWLCENQQCSLNQHSLLRLRLEDSGKVCDNKQQSSENN